MVRTYLYSKPYIYTFNNPQPFVANQQNTNDKNATGSPTAATIIGAACAANMPEVNVTKADRTSMIFLGYLMVNMYILIRIL